METDGDERDPLTDAELEQMERRCDLASKPPWQSFIEGRDHWGGVPASDSDLDFIASARQDIPASSRKSADCESRSPCQPRARTWRRPRTSSGIRTTRKLALITSAAVVRTPRKDLLSGRSRVRVAVGAHVRLRRPAPGEAMADFNRAIELDPDDLRILRSWACHQT
jgi:hypothetical protein